MEEAERERLDRLEREVEQMRCILNEREEIIGRLVSVIGSAAVVLGTVDPRTSGRG